MYTQILFIGSAPGLTNSTSVSVDIIYSDDLSEEAIHLN